MDDGLFLFFFAIFAGGAILVTLFAAFVGGDGEGRKSAGRRGTDGQEPREGAATDIEGATARLAGVEARIDKLSQLILLSGKDPARAELLGRELTLQAYLVDVADKLSALILRRSYRDEFGWLLTLLDDERWMEKTGAFREKLLREHRDFASKPYFGEHSALDEALADILADLDDTTTRLLVAETTRLLDDESPIAEAASLRLRRDEEALATVIAELDRSFDRFAARLELR